MPDRLAAALATAVSRLAPAAQDRLAELVEATVADWADPSPFTPEELSHLREIAAEHFEPADPEAVRVIFATHTA